MKTNLVITGLLFGLVGGFFLGQIGSAAIVDSIEGNIFLIFLICSIAFFTVVLALLFHEKLIIWLFGAKRSNISDWFDNFSEIALNNIPLTSQAKSQLSELSRDALAIVLTWKARQLIFRTLIGVTIAITGTFATYFLIEQNKKIGAQNILIQKQNDAVRTQAMLAVASRNDRYSNSVTELITRISDFQQNHNRNIREETRDMDVYESYAGKHIPARIPSSLSIDIANLVSQLSPYPVFDPQKLMRGHVDPGQLEAKYLNVEKGQILKALLSDRIDIAALRFADFSYSDLRNYKMRVPFDAVGAALYRCDLVSSDLVGLNMDHSDLSNSHFVNVNFPLWKDVVSGNSIFQKSRLSIPKIELDKNKKATAKNVFIDSQVVVFDGDTLAGSVFLFWQVHDNKDKCGQLEFPELSGKWAKKAIDVSFSGAAIMMSFVSGSDSPASTNVGRVLAKRIAVGKKMELSFMDVFPLISEVILGWQSGSDGVINGLIQSNSNVYVEVENIDINDPKYDEYTADIKGSGEDVSLFILRFLDETKL